MIRVNLNPRPLARPLVVGCISNKPLALVSLGSTQVGKLQDHILLKTFPFPFTNSVVISYLMTKTKFSEKKSCAALY